MLYLMIKVYCKTQELSTWAYNKIKEYAHETVATEIILNENLRQEEWKARKNRMKARLDNLLASG